MIAKGSLVFRTFTIDEVRIALFFNQDRLPLVGGPPDVYKGDVMKHLTLLFGETTSFERYLEKIEQLRVQGHLSLRLVHTHEEVMHATRMDVVESEAELA